MHGEVEETVCYGGCAAWWRYSSRVGRLFVVVAARRGGATVAGSADFVVVAVWHGGATVAGSADCLLWWLCGVVALQYGVNKTGVDTVSVNFSYRK